VLIRERTKIARTAERLPRLRLISQRSIFPHIDVQACTAPRHRPVLESDFGTPSTRPRSDLGTDHAALRDIPGQMASLKPESGQAGVGNRYAERPWGVFATAGSDRRGGYGKAFGMRSGWARERRRRARAPTVSVQGSKEAVFEIDVISLHMRLVEATRGS